MDEYKKFYSSTEILEKELAVVFNNDPIFTGWKTSDIKDREMIKFNTGMSYLICKKNNKIYVYENVCPHQGTQLVDNKDTCTSAGKIFCKYHYWSFNIEDGSVSKTPRYEGSNSKGLYSVPFKIWKDFIFILPNNEFDFDKWIEPLEKHIGHYNFQDGIKNEISWAHNVKANWKIVVDNFQDSYHSIFNHKQLEEVVPIKDEVDLEIEHFLIEVIPIKHYHTLSNSPKTKFIPMGEKEVYFFYFFPNIIVGVMPDYYVFQRVIPIDAENSIVENDIYFHKNVPQHMIESQKKDLIDFWVNLNEEDRLLCEAAHRGLTFFKHEKTFLKEYDHLRSAFENKILMILREAEANI
jgi:phenylpropionate dioxygenase-like ring-hydroxylating dioxygenase large terminal subunit